MKTVLNVNGMTCGHCVNAVTEALRPLPGVSAVEVALDGGRATVEHDGRASQESLIAAVVEAGYTASVGSK